MILIHRMKSIIMIHVLYQQQKLRLTPSPPENLDQTSFSSFYNEFEGHELFMFLR